ncbi:MAG: BrnA antitoxin family protein [Defluviitaleaceae bacterium]|nr:BrnA antitoxin family protein [Defluviitaleaceae bacterium]
MNQKIEYTDAPMDIEESLNRAVVIPNFELTQEQINMVAARRSKKPVSIYLSVETIDKFKKAAQKSGNRYQTMISDVLDTYTQQYLH